MKPWIKTLSSLAFVAPAILGLSIVNVQAEEQEKTIEIMIDKENDSDAIVALWVNGKSENFTLPELAEGEVKTIISESGNTITLQNLDGNTTVKIGEELIQLMPLDGNIGANLEFIHDGHNSLPADNKIFIVGGNLPDEVKQALQNTLDSYGVEKELIFPDSSDSDTHVMFFETDDVHDGDKQINKDIKVIKKIIEKKL